MANLAKLNGTTVPVDLYLSNDKSFKKPHGTAELVVRFQTPPSVLLTSVHCYKAGFKINIDDPSDLKEAQRVFERKLNQLNDSVIHLDGRGLIDKVITRVHKEIDNCSGNLRDPDGNLIGAHTVRGLLATEIEKLLAENGIESKCNIGRGTLYSGDDVIINSSITQGTSLNVGIIKFLGFEPHSVTEKQYLDEYYKAPRGSYQDGAWCNKQGDKHLEAAYKILCCDTLIRFLNTHSKLCGIDIKNDSFISDTIDSVSNLQKKLQEEFEGLITSSKSEVKYLLDDSRVKNSRVYQEITQLSLGDAAIKSFVDEEAPFILLNALAKDLGAKRAFKIHPHRSEIEESKTGYFDEFYGPHVALPSAKTRSGMLKLKSELENPDSLASYFFDSSKLKLNVACTASYDHQNDIPTGPIEFLDVCLGIKRPFASNGEVFRFVFEL